MHASGGGRNEQSTDKPETTYLRIDGMHSPTCEAFLEAVAAAISGVADAEASYVSETIRIEHDPDQVSPRELRDALSTLGYTAYLRKRASRDSSGGGGATNRAREVSGVRKRRTDETLGMRYAAGVLFGTFLLVPYVTLVYPSQLAALVDIAALDPFEAAFGTEGESGLFFLRVYFVVTAVVLFFTGMPVLRGAYVGLKMRRPNVDLLVSITVVTAFAYSTIAVLAGRTDVYFDLTVVVAATVTGAMFYEAAVKRRALGRLTDLTVSQVDSARVYEPDGTTAEVPVEAVSPGDRVLVRRGERIPVDGRLDEGRCTVEEAVVTGESLPVEKRAGDELVGGAIVVGGAAVVRTGEEATSSLDRLRDAVWRLQSADHGVRRRADAVAARLVPVVVGAALLAGAAALALGAGPIGTVAVLGTALLVGCPWAIGLATPLSVATSLESALKHGVVVFDETVFRRLRAVDVVVFDKTGTLTTGTMEVLEADAPAALLREAGALERRAAHPAAKAIAAAFAADDEEFRTDGGEPREYAGSVSEFRSFATGVEGIVDGSTVLVGAASLFDERGWTVPADVRGQAAAARKAGQLPVVVGRDGTAAGVIVVGDEPRAGWAESLERLGERGIDVVVLTGDDEAATERFARHPVVSHAFTSVPPAGKTAAIERLSANRRVAMVGDGTNDAPALAAADLGISLGSATALAADAADLVIADDDLAAVETAFDLADAARRRLVRNTRLALAFNAIAIPVAVVGLFTPLTAALAVLVVGGLLAANSSQDLLEPWW
ncbi:heavy metal translocating P-type ATPase [Halobacteria archaeon AArc-dxtr1]|nr:heavy metal translocating P-type ATPase [Halobacteria archaeon AArc-dxtr1]